ncbi:SCO family protein [Phytohabitans sp. LJ34]|uniref:SCO family protein n=1 Tax=Phytohabitans sp. LJ34 TaxID=3452217 RepID=UPI003F8C1D08
MTDTEVAALVDSLRHASHGSDGLTALLPENLPIYHGRSAAEMNRIRGYLLAAFADTGLPDGALPYVIESLETGHDPYEVAGAAIGLRGLTPPPATAVRSLLRAVDNLAGADATVSFERYKPVWPYTQPTTALTEVVRTLGHLGAPARPALEVLAQRSDRFSAPVLREMRRVLDRADARPAPAGGPATGHSCCAGRASRDQGENTAALAAMLEDQDGQPERFEEFFRGKPSVVAFFYTRCDNPYKCSRTITQLAALQRRVHERGLAESVNLAALTYDPEFDLPHRLKRYGSDRGMRFDERARFFRATANFPAIRQRLDLGVNYGTSTVNRHQTEVYVLDRTADVVAAFTRQQWDVDAVLAVVDNLAADA